MFLHIKSHIFSILMCLGIPLIKKIINNISIVFVYCRTMKICYSHKNVQTHWSSLRIYHRISPYTIQLFWLEFNIDIFFIHSFVSKIFISSKGISINPSHQYAYVIIWFSSEQGIKTLFSHASGFITWFTIWKSWQMNRYKKWVWRCKSITYLQTT